MTRLWIQLGRIAYWMTRPAIAICIRFTHRTRVMIICDNHVLLVKGWLSAGQWQLPGGGVHRHESARQGALREVREETGIQLDAADMWPLYQGRVTDGMSFYMTAYSVMLSSRPVVQKQARELIDYAWVPITELSAKELTADSYRLLTVWLKR